MEDAGLNEFDKSNKLDSVTIDKKKYKTYMERLKKKICKALK